MHNGIKRNEKGYLIVFLQLTILIIIKTQNDIRKEYTKLAHRTKSEGPETELPSLTSAFSFALLSLSQRLQNRCTHLSGSPEKDCFLLLLVDHTVSDSYEKKGEEIKINQNFRWTCLGCCLSPSIIWSFF